MPGIYLSESDFSRPRQGDGMGTTWEGHGMCELGSAVQRRHVGDLPAFGIFLLPCRVPGSLLSEACQSQMPVASVKQSNVCHGRGEAYHFGKGRECLYNLQHKHYDNSLVKDDCWKEIAGEWQGSGRGTAWYV
jgi:hypothetical protein